MSVPLPWLLAGTFSFFLFLQLNCQFLRAGTISWFPSHLLLTCLPAKSLQSCPTLCDPIDGSPPGSPVPGILQARTLEWVAISFSNAGKWKVKVKSLSRVWLLATPWAAAYQAPPSMGFSRQEYWSGVRLPSPLLLTLQFNHREDNYLLATKIVKFWICAVLGLGQERGVKRDGEERTKL